RAVGTKGDVHWVAAAAKAVQSGAGLLAPGRDHFAVLVVTGDSMASVLRDEDACVAALNIHLSAAAAEVGDDFLAARKVAVEFPDAEAVTGSGTRGHEHVAAGFANRSDLQLVLQGGL